MKRLLALLLFAASAAHAQAPSYAWIFVGYTPGAAACLGGDAAARTAITNAFNAVSNDYASQNIMVPPQVPYAPAIGLVTGGPPDGTPSKNVQTWAQNSAVVWQARKNAVAGGAIIVSNPGSADVGITPGPSTPTTARLATSAINCSDLANQMRPALDRIIGIMPSTGITVRSRVYNGENVCFHTQDAPASDKNQLLPYLQGWTAGAVLNTHSPTASGACEQYRKSEVAYHSGDSSYAGYYVSATLTGGSPSYTCTTYNNASPPVATSSSSINAWSQGTGSSTITCPGTGEDTLVYQYSCNPANSHCAGTNYYTTADGQQTWQYGDATHDAVGAANARGPYFTGTSGGMLSTNATELQNAKNAISWVPDWVRTILN